MLEPAHTRSTYRRCRCRASDHHWVERSAEAHAGSERDIAARLYRDIQSPDPDVQCDIPGMELVNNIL